MHHTSPILCVRVRSCQGIPERKSGIEAFVRIMPHRATHNVCDGLRDVRCKLAEFPNVAPHDSVSLLCGVEPVVDWVLTG